MRRDLVALLRPAGTFMDLNIGAALSVAATCTGVLKRLVRAGPLGDSFAIERVAESYTSAARVILMGKQE